MEGDTPTANSSRKNNCGIPEAEFMEDVNKYMESPEVNGNAELILKKLDEQHNKYKFMEYNLLSKKRRLNTQIPDLERSVEMIKFLMKQRESPESFTTDFLLFDQVFLKATVEPTDKVCLWLGANVMLEHTLEDALKLLEKNMTGAKENLDIIDNDVDFIRDQLTTTEVNMARVYNWNVKKRQAAKGSS